MKLRPALVVAPRWRVAAVGLGYFACVVMSLAFTRFDGSVAFVWSANAFLIAWLALSPRGEHRGAILICVAAGAAATLAFGAGVRALPLSLLSVIESVATVHILRRFVRKSTYFDDARSIGAFAVIAGGLVPALCAPPAGLVASYALGKPFASSALAWFAGHALGTIALTSALMLLLQRRERGADTRAKVHPLEIALLFGAVAGTTAVVFAQNTLPLLFVPMLPMMIATLRLERLGAAVSIVVLTLVGGGLTMTGHGPIPMMDQAQGSRIQFLQFYIATAAGLVLPVAALLRQRGALLADLSASEAAYRLLTESSGDAIFNIALDGTIRHASHSVFALGGLLPKNLVGKNALDSVVAEDRALVVAARKAVIGRPGTTVSVEYRCTTTDGRVLWFESRARAIVDEYGRPTGTVSAVREVSDRKAAETELAQAATTDPLTGLLNRRGFMTVLERPPEPGSRAGAVAIVDLDHFKLVNDRHGHAVGDLVLCAFADVARRMLRSSDAIGRVGGEEFALLLRNIDTDRAMALCERLRAALAAAHVTAPDGTRVGITASFGIAAIDGAVSGSEALEAADKALYQAKAMGRNRLRLAA